MDRAPRTTWREVFDKHHAALVADVGLQLDAALQSNLEAAVSAAVRAASGEERANAVRQVEHVRVATAEALNQTLRRLRQTPSEAAALELLADASAPWADKAVVLSFENNQFENNQFENNQFENNQVHSLAARNLAGNSFSFPLDSAGAIQSAIESQDPMVALASASEISAALAEGFVPAGSGDSVKAYLFPVVARQTVVAMLVAVGSVVAAPLELLSEAAGMKLEMLSAPAVLKSLKSPELVQIAVPSIPASASGAGHPWDELSAEDQKLHLQAQRVARVRVAELRLYHPDELRKGVFAGEIYDALRAGIDDARAGFLEAFLSKSATMVDYLHLEILRSLAHDDDRLLGKDYPGPMV